MDFFACFKLDRGHKSFFPWLLSEYIHIISIYIDIIIIIVYLMTVFVCGICVDNMSIIMNVCNLNCIRHTTITANYL